MVLNPLQARKLFNNKWDKSFNWKAWYEWINRTITESVSKKLS